jgi:hypothetical protein
LGHGIWTIRNRDGGNTGVIIDLPNRRIYSKSITALNFTLPVCNNKGVEAGVNYTGNGNFQISSMTTYNTYVRKFIKYAAWFWNVV